MPGPAGVSVIWVQIAQWMALLPMAALLVLHCTGRARDLSWWLLASAFAVSWIADSLVLSWPPNARAGWMIAAIYPAMQASIVGAVLIGRRTRAIGFAVVAHLAAFASILLHGVEGPEYASRILAWGTIAVVAWRFWQLGALRTALLIYFGGGLVTWIVHTEWLVVATWWPYQGSRLVGLCWFCYAASKDRLTALRLERVRAA